jgi:hypothetical protein
MMFIVSFHGSIQWIGIHSGDPPGRSILAVAGTATPVAHEAITVVAPVLGCCRFGGTSTATCLFGACLQAASLTMNVP